MADPLDELYAGPLETFVARRKELAAARKKAGDDEGAASLKAAVKPTQSAWVVNQVAHRRPEVVRGLLASTADVIRAQLDAGGGSDDRRRYERALAKRRDAEEQLKDAVREVVDAPSAEVVRRVLENFRRGALDAEARELLRAGRLTRDVELPDFGAMLHDLGAAPRGTSPDAGEVGARKSKVEAEKARAAERAQAERRRKEAEAAAERERRVTAARKEVEKAEQRAERLRAELAVAEREVERARAVLERT